MKKSIEEAKAQARQISEKNPDATVWVMDKLKHKAVVVCFEWVRKERILDGWHVVTTYRAGKEV